MVFKEYKPVAQDEVSFKALSAMPRFVEDALPSRKDGEQLLNIAAWPCAVVDVDGQPVGHVMPAIPDKFSIELTTAKGKSVVNAEFQHLLNHESVLIARGLEISDAQRYSLLREVATALEFLHDNDICVGDISPKNMLFSLEPSAAVYFIDCDTMSVRGISAMPQAETPGWEVPQGEPSATIYADTYKMALLALRLLAGDQDVRDPGRLPSRTPELLRKIVTDTLTKPAERRPLPAAWTYVLAYAIEEAQHRELEHAPGTASKIPPPAIPIVRARPVRQTKSSGAAGRTASAAAKPTASDSLRSRSAVPQAASSDQSQNILIGVAAGVSIAAVVGLVIWLVMSVTETDSNSARTRPQGVNDSAYTEPTSRSESYKPTTTRQTTPLPQTQTSTPSVALSPPPSQRLPTGQDANQRTCPDGILVGDGLQAVRGSNATTCQFARSVGTAYAGTVDRPSSTYVDIRAIGSVPCSSVPGRPRCTTDGSDAFIMTCAILGSENWVTCRGGNNAVVYIY